MSDLRALLSAGLQRNPSGVAIREPGAQISYREFDALVDRLAWALAERGVGRGDRVAVWLPKSINAVAAMQAAMRVGAAYVPVDPMSPAARVRQILIDCGTAACATLPGWADAALVDELADVPRLLVDEDGGPGAWSELRMSTSRFRAPDIEPSSLAYILYTSGSTGTPKGVAITHRNAFAFLDWARDELQPEPSDRFANHAPLHFDLSVLDLYLAFWSGAAVLLVPETMSFIGRRVVELIAREWVTVWYSVPSALIMMMEQGGLADAHLPSLHTILFAGEPFPIKHLRRLREAFPLARLINLYGPTETNVCTFHEVGDIAEDCEAPVPIGRACSGDRVWLEATHGRPVLPGEMGEVVVDGPTVMHGYWGREPHTGPYRTGDIAREIEPGVLEYVGRRDAMVKVRGHRVELGDVESALQSHPTIRKAAVIVVGSGMSARLIAALVMTDGDEAPLLEIKRHCAERLPRYMIVHEVMTFHELPRTRNGKVDRRAIAERVAEAVVG